MKIAILTKPDDSSPKVLAEALKYQLCDLVVKADIFYELSSLNRLVSYRDSKWSLHFWLSEKLSYYKHDKKLLQTLKEYDAVVISECIPNAFRKINYNVERLKRIIKRPVLHYGVFFLGNTPSHLKRLETNGDALLDRYDFHLSVSSVTEISLKPDNTWYPIGIAARSWHLTPDPKNELLAIIDFPYTGNEYIREMQIRCLQKVGIKHISLNRHYTVKEIRNIYSQGSLYFMQSPESFGVPILECLCCGNQIFTNDVYWPMSWRLPLKNSNSNRAVPDCFTIYGDEDDLMYKLLDFKNDFMPSETPKKVFQTFLDHYPDFYYGNTFELTRVVNNLRSKIETNLHKA